MQAPECPKCPQGTASLSECAAMPWPESGLPNLVLHGAWQHRCGGCQATSISIPALGPLCRALARALVWKGTRLSAREIVFLRKSLEMTGTELAEEMRISASALSFGKIPPSSEILLRLIVARRALTPADVWGILSTSGLKRIGRDDASPARWWRATFLELGEPDIGEDGPYWLVQTADGEMAARVATSTDAEAPTPL